MSEKKYTYTIGRRKTATATLRLFEEAGKNTVNEKPIEEYFPNGEFIHVINEVFSVSGLNPKEYYFTVKVEGSGISAQSEAIRHALARAVIKSHPEAKTEVKKAGFLTRDPRKVERKKAGLRKARKSEQYSKR